MVSTAWPMRCFSGLSRPSASVDCDRCGRFLHHEHLPVLIGWLSIHEEPSQPIPVRDVLSKLPMRSGSRPVGSRGPGRLAAGRGVSVLIASMDVLDLAVTPFVTQ